MRENKSGLNPNATSAPDLQPWGIAAPIATVFASSACIMVIELVAGRIVSRYLGQSLYTWTSIIGVVLAGISIGNYFGGRLADRSFGRGTISIQFIAAGALCMSVLATNAWLGPVLAVAQISWPMRILLHVTAVFLLPAAALGTISPVIARRALECGAAPGRTVGNVYAWATAGSILGAFATGYYLLMWLGVTAVIVAASLFLASIGVVYLLGSIMSRARIETRSAPADQAPRAKQASVDSPFELKAWIAPMAAILVASVCVMVLEVAAGRIISRQYGQSLYTWTAVICTVLAGMSLGSYLGGRCADRFAPRRTLCWLFLAGAATTEGVLILSRFFADQTLLIGLSWPMQIAAHVAGTFFLPSVALGAVSPVAVKAALADPRTAGRTIGSLYAWGSVASILGTFLAGFFLIAALGTVHVVHGVAIVLTVTAIAFQYKARLPYIGGALCLATAFAGLVPVPALEDFGQRLGLRDVPPANAVYLDESQYSYIAITSKEGQPDVREMVLDHLIHSRVDLTNPRDLRYEYEWVYTAVMDKYYPEGEPMDALVIGGGGYTYPHYLEATRPGSRVDVAEIDPAVTKAAFAAFGLPRDAAINIFNMDARNFVDDMLRENASGPRQRKYDCILGDSVNDYSVPYHLTTFEFNEKLNRLLKDDGVYMLNLIELFNSGRFLGAVINTCRKTFPNIYVFSSLNDPTRRDTFVVVNAKRPLDLSEMIEDVREQYGYSGEFLDETQMERLRESAGGLILTDDFAPVEIMLAPVAQTSRETYPSQLVNTANQMLAEGNLDDAIDSARLVLRSGMCTVEAHEVIGTALLRKERPDEAIVEFNAALRIDPSYVSTRLLLAKAYWRIRDYDQAWEQVRLLQAAGESIDPGFLELLKRDSGRSE